MNTKPPCSAQTGWIVQTPTLSNLNRPPRPRLQRSFAIFFDVAATPPWLRRGVSAFGGCLCRAPSLCCIAHNREPRELLGFVKPIEPPPCSASEKQELDRAHVLLNCRVLMEVQ